MEYLRIFGHIGRPQVLVSIKWKRNDAHAGFVKQAMAKGLKVFFTSHKNLETWMTEENPDEYVEWAMAILLRWRELGVELPYFSILNEPGYKRGGFGRLIG